jgi:class 3 adenylate cyclase
MDIHHLPADVTPQMLEHAHKLDLEVQEKHGVQYHGYWYDKDARTVACLVEGPNREACDAVHREAHGLVAENIIEVTSPGVTAFLGGGAISPSGVALLPNGTPDTGLRVLLFTQLDNLAAVGSRFGDEGALRLVQHHDDVVRRNVAKHGGREVQHTGDGAMLSFASASAAVQGALDIQRECGENVDDAELPRPSVRIGMAAGEPVARHQSLFGVAVDQARAICAAARPGEILMSSSVRELCAGKAFNFAPPKMVRLTGVEEPVTVVAISGTAGAQRTGEPSRLKDALGSRYVVERELGRGGGATVFLAKDARYDREVAIKVLRAELAEMLGADRFLHEIRVSAKLTHPNIVALYDSGEANGVLYYVMPLLHGETLREVITRERQLPVDRAIEIIRNVAKGLDHAHRQGVIHRDIKPENIFLHEGQPVILDFGIALALATAGADRLTQAGSFLGTPAYMSPEQAAGDRDLDVRADVYALGCVLYEMLAGDPPFTGSNLQSVIAKILHETPARIARLRPSVPAHVDEAVNRAIAKVPADRFSSAGDFAAALTR